MNRRQQKRQQARRRAHGPSPDRPRNTMSRASYSTVKQGHIIPATYQRNFAVDEMVAVHVPGRADCVTLNVAKAGTRGPFYRRSRTDGSQIDDIEASLASLEDVAGPVLKEVATGAPLTLERKGVLAQFLGTQMLRGPAFFSAQHGNIEQFVPKALTTAHVTPLLLERPATTSRWRGNGSLSCTENRRRC